MKLSAWPLLAPMLFNMLPVDTYASENLLTQGDWEFLYSDDKESDRAMCSLSVSAMENPSGEILNIQSSPGKPIVALMGSGLLKGSTVSWDVDGMQAIHFEIGGEQEMTPIGLRALSALGAGKKLTIYVNDKTAGTFSLNGSGAAIDKFMECWTGSNNPRKANRVLGSTFINGKYNDLVIKGDEVTSVAPAIRRDVIEDGLSAYFVPGADDGKVVTKGYMFIFEDSEKASHFVAVSTLTRNATGEVETELDDELAGSCVESDSNILCYGVGYGKTEYRLNFDKVGSAFISDGTKKEAADPTLNEAAEAVTKDESNPFGKTTATPAKDSSPEELDTPAAERVYYRETPWELALVVDDSGVQNPFCALRTTLWHSQQVSLEFTLTGLDTVGEFFRLHKTGWNLPAGATTKVGLKFGLSSDQFVPIKFDVSSGDGLYASFESQTREGKLALLLAFGFAQQGKLRPAQATFRFKGNEPEWAVAAASMVDFPALDRAYLECRTELLKLGHQRFSVSGVLRPRPLRWASRHRPRA